MDAFPGNSNKIRMTEPEKPEAASEQKTADKPEPITKGKVTHRKRPLGLRFKDMFVTDGRGYAEELVQTIVIPMFKETLDSVIVQMVEGFKKGVQQAIFGDTPRPSGSVVRSSPFNYNKISTTSSTTSIRRTTGGISSRAPVRRSNVIKEVTVKDRATGQAVIDELVAMCDSIGHVTVGDYYNLVQVPIMPTDESWGWGVDELAHAQVSKIALGEFLIDMPRPLPIEN